MSELWCAECDVTFSGNLCPGCGAADDFDLEGKAVIALLADRGAWRECAVELAGMLQEDRLVYKSLRRRRGVVGAARDIAYAFRAIARIDAALATYDKLKGDE